MTPESLLQDLSPPLDPVLASSLIQEFVDLERRYVLGDWEPATLDGGQFAELASRIIYHVDSGNLNRRKDVDACLKYVEDPADSNAHRLLPRRTAGHLCRVLRVLYKFRSQRGAVHIDPEYDANELDATFVVGMVRWLMAEILRVFWSGDREKVARVIREIVRYEVPALMVVDGRPFILRTDLTVEEEVLLALHHAGESGNERQELNVAIPKSPRAIGNALSRLGPSGKREIVRRADGKYLLTPTGMRRIREELSGKLTI